MTDSGKVPLKCVVTGKVIEVKVTPKRVARLPAGWKRNDKGEPVSGEGWKSLYVLRAVTFPVMGPENLSWPELRD